jgi:hypothetical protein
VTIESQGKERTVKLVARIRKFVYLGVLVGIAWFCIRYNVSTIPEDYNHLAPQHMPAGATVVTIDYDNDVHLGIGSVVFFEAPGHKGEHAFGVVAGLPGETLMLLQEKPGEGQLQVEDRREILVLPLKHKLRSGVIPDDQFLILNGDRHLDSGVGAPDCRVFGLVPRENLRSKIITSLSAFSR